MSNAWPSTHEYTKAIQTPGICFQGQPLQHADVALHPHRRVPLIYSGNFACVYRVTQQGRDHAVRCFTSPVNGQEARYDRLSRMLRNVLPPAFVNFAYQPRGIMVQGAWYPTIQMDWVQGEPLNRFVQANRHSPEAIRHVAARWRGTMSSSLRGLGIAHNDLQHGNVMVEQGDNIRLVDYDSTYIPEFHGSASPELGHRHYQHPQRSTRDYGDHIDNFPALVIYLSLLAIASDPTLWTFNNDDNLLFVQEDYRNPRTSTLFQHLHASPDPTVAQLTRRLEECCAIPVDQVPDLEYITRDMHPATDAPTLASPGAPMHPGPETTDAPEPSPRPTPVTCPSCGQNATGMNTCVYCGVTIPRTQPTAQTRPDQGARTPQTADASPSRAANRRTRKCLGCGTTIPSTSRYCINCTTRYCTPPPRTGTQANISTSHTATTTPGASGPTQNHPGQTPGQPAPNPAGNPPPHTGRPGQARTPAASLISARLRKHAHEASSITRKALRTTRATLTTARGIGATLKTARSIRALKTPLRAPTLSRRTRTWTAAIGVLALMTVAVLALTQCGGEDPAAPPVNQQPLEQPGAALPAAQPPAPTTTPEPAPTPSSTLPPTSTPDPTATPAPTKTPIPTPTAPGEPTKTPIPTPTTPAGVQPPETTPAPGSTPTTTQEPGAGGPTAPPALQPTPGPTPLPNKIRDDWWTLRHDQLRYTISVPPGWRAHQRSDGTVSLQGPQAQVTITPWEGNITEFAHFRDLVLEKYEERLGDKVSPRFHQPDDDRPDLMGEYHICVHRQEKTYDHVLHLKLVTREQNPLEFTIQRDLNGAGLCLGADPDPQVDAVFQQFHPW